MTNAPAAASLITSAITTAVDARYIVAPAGAVAREYRMVNASDAFWTTSTTSAAYLVMVVVVLLLLLLPVAEEEEEEEAPAAAVVVVGRS
jgi:hypothetical protein